MTDPSGFTADELRWIADREFCRVKAGVTKKVRGLLERLHAGLREDLAGQDLLSPVSFDPARFQFVKGEHLEDYPYQYLDFPKHFEGDEKFTFRSLFWWGHHFAFALILESEQILLYKQHLINRYHMIAGRNLYISLSPSLWEWNIGEGFTLPLTHDRKSEVSAVLSGRRAFKLLRCLSHDDPLVIEGRVVEAAREAFRAMLPVITR